MTKVSRLIASLAVVAMSVAPAFGAGVITQWNFNTTVAANNAPAPSIGTGAATPVGMNNNANGADIVAAGGSVLSSDTGTPNNAWRVRGSTSNGWSGTTQLLSGARFNVSTAGVEDVVVRFEVQATDGSPRHGQFQYTIDGSNFVSFGDLIDFNRSFDGWAPFVYNLSALPAVEDNPQFGFKLVSAFSPVEFTNLNGTQAANTAFQRASATNQVYNGTAGNWRFDMVTVSATAVPEPAALSLLALGGLLALRRSRCHG
jgi:hypothetical protein